MATWPRNTSGLIQWKPGYSGNPQCPPLTADELQKFLDLLSEAYPATEAAKIVGRHRDSFYEFKRNNADYATAWDAAVEARGDWYENRLKAKASPEGDKGDTVAVIVGLKMTGRFVERPAITQIQVNVAENRPFSQYSVEQLKAQLDALEAPIIEAEVKELKDGKDGCNESP